MQKLGAKSWHPSQTPEKLREEETEWMMIDKGGVYFLLR